MMIFDVLAPKSWVSKPTILPSDRQRITDWIYSLRSRGVIHNNVAYLLVYNSKAPEMSYIIKEQIDI